MRGRTNARPRADLAVLVAILVGMMATGPARAADPPADPPGVLVVVMPGDSVGKAGFYIDESRLNYYLDAESQLLDLRVRYDLSVELDSKEVAYTEALERRVSRLDRPSRDPALWLGTGIVIGVAIVVLTALAARGFSSAFASGS